MDWLIEHWTALIGPAVVAAAVSGLVAVAGLIVSTRTARALHSEKLEFDRQLAERKVEFDKEIAERKFKYDRDLHDHKRKAELAEATLASVYEMEDILRAAREPWVLPHEMAKKVGVPDETATSQDYAPEARLLERQEFFARFRSQKFAFAAVFGLEAAKPLDELWQCRVKINDAVFTLLRNKEMPKRDENYRALLEAQRAIAFRVQADEDDVLGKRISEHVSNIEETCSPAIEARAIVR